MAENLPVKVATPTNKMAKAAKIIAIVIFALILTALIGAIVSDIVIFSAQIAGFIVACIMAIAAFFIGIILMVLSIVCIFGVYLLEEYGFWPLTWMNNAFMEVMSDLGVTQEQINILITVRIILLIICILVFAASIVALTLAKKAKKENPEIKQGLTKAFSIVALILSILGLFAATAMMLLFVFIK